MFRGFFLVAPVSLALYVGLASAQQPSYPILEPFAQKVVQKYQPSSCQDLAWQKSQPAGNTA